MKGKLALAILSSKPKTKEDEKEETTDSEMADAAFDSFFAAVKKGDKEAAKSSLKAFLHECSEY